MNIRIYYSYHTCTKHISSTNCCWLFPHAEKLDIFITSEKTHQETKLDNSEINFQS